MHFVSKGILIWRAKIFIFGKVNFLIASLFLTPFLLQQHSRLHCHSLLRHRRSLKLINFILFLNYTLGSMSRFFRSFLPFLPSSSAGTFRGKKVFRKFYFFIIFRDKFPVPSDTGTGWYEWKEIITKNIYTFFFF